MPFREPECHRQRTVFSIVSQSNAENVWSAGDGKHLNLGCARARRHVGKPAKDQRLLSFTSKFSVLAVILVGSLPVRMCRCNVAATCCAHVVVVVAVVAVVVVVVVAATVQTAAQLSGAY